MIAALGLLPSDRQSVIILAFWVLVGAGIVVSVGAWILLRRESRAGKPPKREPESAPGGSDGDAPAVAGPEPAEAGPEPAETGPAPV